METRKRKISQKRKLKEAESTIAAVFAKSKRVVPPLLSAENAIALTTWTVYN